MIKKIIKSRAFVPIVISALFIIAAFCKIDLSIWHDESYSAYLIKGNFGDIWNLTAVDVHPPLFYFCLKLWSLLFGTSIIALRSMSVFFGVIAIFLGYFLIKKLFNNKAAIISTVLLAFSPLFLKYSEEARMYTMVITIVFGATLLFKKAIDEKKIWYWLLYGVLVAIGMMTHYFSVLAWITHFIYLIYIYKEKIFNTKVMLAYLLAFCIFLPWLPNCIKQFTAVQSDFWIPSISGNTLIDYSVEALTSIQYASWVSGWLALLTIIIVFFFVGLIVRYLIEIKGMPKDGIEKRNYVLLGMLAFLPPALLVILSMPPLRPMFVTRYIIYSATVFWMLVGVLLSKLKINNKNIFIMIAVIITILYGDICVFSRWAKSDIKELMNNIGARVNGDSLIITDVETAYLDAVHYSNDSMLVYGVSEYYSDRRGVFEPMKVYRYNIVDSFDELPMRENVWIIYNTNEDVKIPDGYTIIDQIRLNEHSAIKIR